MIALIATIVEILLYLLIIGFAIAGVVIGAVIALFITILRQALLNIED